ncbi:MAG: hypothetical protein ABSC56_01095 [Solirubrobacteraceae bacterium]|jgi:hypothetical protein
MDPILVDSTQLRALQLPGVNLAVGRVMVARVIEAELGGKGLLSIAGARLAATLPPGVHAGDELRLVVREVSPERLVLGMQPPEQAREEEVTEQEGGGGSGAPASQTVALRYETASLGPIDLRFDLYAGGALSVTVLMASADGEELARAAAPELRERLATATARDIGLTIGTQRPPLDMYV